MSGFSRVGDASVFISQNAGKEIEIKYKRNTEIFLVKITPRINPPSGEGALGIAMDEIGTVKLPIYRAVIEGTKMTYNVVVGTALSLFYFVIGAIKGDVGTLAPLLTLWASPELPAVPPNSVLFIF